MIMLESYYYNLFLKMNSHIYFDILTFGVLASEDYYEQFHEKDSCYRPGEWMSAHCRSFCRHPERKAEHLWAFHLRKTPLLNH